MGRKASFNTYRAKQGEYCAGGGSSAVIDLAAAALFAFAQPAAATRTTPDIRVIRAVKPAIRYVRLLLDIQSAGVHGTAVSLFDLSTGRNAEKVAAGPLTSGDGFDGRRGWSSDSSGMAGVDENADAARDDVAWAHFFGRRGPEQPVIRRRGSTGRRLVLRLIYPELSGPIDVTFDRKTGLVVGVVDRSGLDTSHVVYRDYRAVGGVLLPFTHTTTTRYGVSHAHVRAVEFPRSVPPNAFSPPPPPDDVRLDGVTTIPMKFIDGVPVVPIRIDNGPELHVLFDSGAANYLKPRAARRLGLRLAGDDKSGGIGPNLVRERYTTVKRLRIGAAALTNQPFAVIDDDTFGPTVDGAVGCEVLQRLAVRFDFAHRRVALTRDVRRFGAITTPSIPLRVSTCSPEIDGSLDGVRGAVALDTGSGSYFDVMGPVVRSHGLVAKYHTTRLYPTGSGIGGETHGYFAFARELRLGPIVVADVPIFLDSTPAGAFNDPTQLGNAGVPLFRDFVTIFDYRSHRFWLLR